MRRKERTVIVICDSFKRVVVHPFNMADSYEQTVENRNDRFIEAAVLL
jgi:hypothetical protein